MEGKEGVGVGSAILCTASGASLTVTVSALAFVGVSGFPRQLRLDRAHWGEA